MPPSSGRVTIYEVADEARVAISTVSRVLNGSPEVSDATRAKVQAAIEKLQFQPQRIAKSLAQQATTSLAVALPSATSLFYVEILKGVKDVLRDRDIDLLLCNLGSSNPEQTLQRFIGRGAVGGLLLASLQIDDALGEQLRRMHAPVVSIGGRNAGFDSFWWNDEAGARKATEHLLELGHRRIGIITSQAWSYASEPRLRGYRAALESAGIAFDPELVAAGTTTKHAGFSEEVGAEAMAELLALEHPPSAVFSSSDVQAFGAWAHARDSGLVVPRDLSILGYDNLKLSRYLNLTSIDQRMQEVGRRATERLLSRMESRDDDRLDIEIPLELMVRGSTGPYEG
ncbi:MAG: LacI family DNA-binding transcriptional regulator [Rubricoccaceae bacterium]